jgi:TonB family protein
MMSRAILQRFTVGSALLFASALGAQTPAPAIDPAISEIAASIAAPIREQHATRIIVADLRGPEDSPQPAGKWLAGQLSQSLQTNFPDLQVLTPPDNSAEPSTPGKGTSAVMDSLEADRLWARNLGANVVITGAFARKGEGIGISLWAVYSSDLPRLIGRARGSIQASTEFAGMLPDPISPSDSGAARAGVNRATAPECISCPPPSYSREALEARLQGSVILQITVTSDGRASRVMVVKGPGTGLEEQAIKAVRTWTFKPAVAPSGKPAAVIVPIVVTFR